MKAEICRSANFTVIVGTTGCYSDNLWCRQWRQSWNYDKSDFSNFPLITVTP